MGKSKKNGAMPQVASHASFLQAANMPQSIPPYMHDLSELMFYASVGNLQRCMDVASRGRLDLADAKVADYDLRTPLHVAADSGSLQVAEWLINTRGCPLDPVDRFKNTPLACAARSRHDAMVALLVTAGGQVLGADNVLCEIRDSPLAGMVTVGADAINAGQDSSLQGGRFFESETNRPEDEWAITADELELEGIVGQGMFGTVYKAKWRGTNVVVKKLKVDFGEAQNELTAFREFRSELQVMAFVHHPCTVQFLGCVLTKPYMLVTEFCPGGSLADAFRSPAAFTQRRACEACLDIARGMAYLHLKRPKAIIHRDLKPANLLFSKSGRLKIGDFGLSKSLDVRHVQQDKVLNEAYTMTGETGSYRYMAPEVFRHEAYGTAVDVYAFSMIAYQCFTWSVPLSDYYRAVEAARAAALSGARPDPAVVPTKRARVLLQRCWDEDMTLRPQFLEIIAELETVMAELDSMAGSGGGGGAGGSGCCAVS